MTEAVGRQGRTVNEVVTTFGRDWHTVNEAVLAYSGALVEHPGRFGAVEALGAQQATDARLPELLM